MMARLGNRVLPLVVMMVAALLLAACAGPQKLRGEMRYDMSASEGRFTVFPPPPDVPRFAFAGELVGERNFLYEKPEKTFGQRALEILTGIVDGNPLEIELLRPQAVATDSKGRVVVSDAGRAGVLVFDPLEGEVRVIRQVSAGRVFVSPTGVAIGDNDEIFVADAQLGVVVRLSSTGDNLALIGEGLLQRPTGLVYDKIQRRLFVTDTAAGALKVFDVEGRLLMTVGKPGDGPGEFNRPTYLASWRNELYVADTLNARVQVFDLDSGQFIRIVGMRGIQIGQFALPKGIAVDSEGNLYVVESLFDHLLVFDHDGRFLLPIGGTGYGTDKFYLPAGIWVDEGNRVYVADMYNGRVVTYLYLGSDSENREAEDSDTAIRATEKKVE